MYGVNPDIIALAKGLAGGVPVGAMLAVEKFANVFEPGDHASTFGGNPLAAAAGNAVIDEILLNGILENVGEMNKYFLQKMHILKEKYSFIKDIRGLGLMLGMEVSISPKEIVEAALKDGLLILSAGTNVVRFVPPLVIDKKATEEGFAILDKVLKNIKGE